MNTPHTQSYLTAHLDILEPLQGLGLGVDDYDSITHELTGSVIKSVTKVRPGEYYIVLQSATASRVVQLLGNKDDYTIASQPITHSSRS